MEVTFQLQTFFAYFYSIIQVYIQKNQNQNYHTMRNQQASLYQPIFAFSTPQFKPNKLPSKSVPTIEIDTTNNTIKCKDSDTQVATVKAQYPLLTNNIIAFFQVQILQCNSVHSKDCGVNIGLITKDGNPKVHAGRYTNSVGYFQGDIYLNKKKIGSVTRVGRKDRLGCGINCSNMSFFFTKNDEIIAKDLALPEGSKWNEFYPAVALQYNDETVKCYFEKKDFMFDIDTLAKDIQQQVKAEILNEDSDNEEIASSEIYSLISEYMLFNGYSKTLQMMKIKKAEIQFEPVNKLTKSIHGSKVPINLDEEKLQSVKENEYLLESLQAKSGKQNQNSEMKEEENNLKEQFQPRQRIMSDVHPEMVQSSSMMMEEANEPRRKNTELGPMDLPQGYNLRKESNISNVSLIDEESLLHYQVQDKGHNNHYEKQQNPYQESLTLNEKFLLKERLQILSFIKNKQIQSAEKIIISQIPKLYELQPLLQPYMKAHIFLRKIIEEDQKSAIIYARTQEKFVKNVDKLFPTYDQAGNIEMIPMKKIMTAILMSKNQQHKFLRKEQFEYFADYVNTCIMKWMGVMGNSRLGMIMEHSSIALRKLQDFKGMTCGIKLLN